jgi:hypothetical protein
MSTTTALAEHEFGAIFTADEAVTMLRDHLPGKVRGIQQCVLLGAMDKAKTIAFIKSQIAEGEDATLHFLSTVTDFEAWASDLAQMASGMTARVLCAAAEVVNLPARGAV